MKKKLLALTLCLALLLGSLGAVTVFAEGAQTYDAENNLYTVSTADELIAAIAEINSDAANCGRNIKLADNIDLTGKEFTPLADYAGTFDGNQKTISGLKTVGGANAGLIATSAGCTVKDLTVSDALVSATAYVGAIVGKAGADTITGCTVINSVILGTGTSAIAGGIVGNASADTIMIDNCMVSNTRVESAAKVAGGLLGSNTASGSTATIQNSTVFTAPGAVITIEGVEYAPEIVTKHTTDGHAAGVIGNPKGAFVINNINVVATVISNKYSGGVTGQAAGGGTVTNAVINSNVTGKNYAAGVIAGEGSALTYTLTNCLVTGVYNSANLASGLAGYSSGETWNFNNCVVIGTFNGTKGNGAIFGQTKKCTINVTNCVGNIGFFADLVCDNTTKLTESGSKVIGTEATAMVNKFTYTSGKNFTLNGTTYTDATETTASDAAYAYQLPAVDKFAVVNTLIAELFADAGADFVATAKQTASNRITGFLGYQTRANGEGRDIRFLAYVDSKDYAAAGLKIQATIGGEQKTATYAVKAVYTSVNATIGDTTATVTVEDLGNYGTGYLIAVVVTGVPASVTEFTVAPYVTAGTTVFEAAPTSITVAN
ncbi:MAG: hypothetical protein E7620_05075 [Ruminococcaceae bacterium]|nr:hypothetical protein [Oscillospiraceae bacterium]